MINNFDIIDNFLQFEFDGGSFYKFELLVRNTDGNNSLYKEGYSNVNKNILIKSWCVDSEASYNKVKHEMITLANMTGARLYVTLDRKDNRKLVQSIARRFFDLSIDMANGAEPAIKGIAKAFASETSKVENSCKDKKTIMFDVDTNDIGVKQLIEGYIKSKGQEPYVLETKKGYHIFCYRKFDFSNWEQECRNAVDQEWSELEPVYTSLALSCFENYVDVKPNALGLVYHPEKRDLYDDLLEVIQPYLGDFTGYDEKEQAFNIVQAVKELLED